MSGRASLGSVIAILAAIAAPVAVRPANADSVFDLTTCQMSSGCGGPGTVYGTVTLSTVSSTEVLVTLALTGSEVFAVGGAGEPLLFEITDDPAISVSSVTAPNAPSGVTFSFTNAGPNGQMANGTGSWDYFIGCTGCGNGTNKGVMGPLSFYVTLASGITPGSFTTNPSGFYFVTDIGLSKGSASTGDVAATAPVPLPPSLPLMAAGLGCLALVAARFRGPATPLVSSDR